MSSIVQDGIDFESYKCTSCGEEILDMKQLAKLAKCYRSLRKAKEITFAKWGNSIAVRIPNELVNEFNIQEGKHGVITKDNKGIRIIPV